MAQFYYMTQWASIHNTRVSAARTPKYKVIVYVVTYTCAFPKCPLPIGVSENICIWSNMEEPILKKTT